MVQLKKVGLLPISRIALTFRIGIACNLQVIRLGNDGDWGNAQNVAHRGAARGRQELVSRRAIHLQRRLFPVDVRIGGCKHGIYVVSRVNLGQQLVLLRHREYVVGDRCEGVKPVSVQLRACGVACECRCEIRGRGVAAQCERQHVVVAGQCAPVGICKVQRFDPFAC